MNDLQTLNARIAKAGGLPSQANLAVKELIDTGVLTLAQAMPILEPLRALTPALEDIQQWHDAQVPATPAKPALPPGMQVVDVAKADGDYTGPIDVAQLSIENKRYINDNLGAFSNQWGQVFNGKVRFPDEPGILVNGARDQIVRDAAGTPVADLAAFV